MRGHKKLPMLFDKCVCTTKMPQALIMMARHTRLLNGMDKRDATVGGEEEDGGLTALKSSFKACPIRIIV